MANKIISIVLVLIWMSMIFILSNAKGESSGSLSRSIIVTITETITDYREPNPEIDKIVDKYQFVVRKGAHFLEYFVLALLVMNMLYTLEVDKRVLIIACLICIAYAASDELHQSYIAGRSGNLIDVMWDSSASLIGSSLFYMIKTRRMKDERKDK